MKKVIWGAVLVAIISFIVLSNDPLNDTVNFIIAGSIPGTTFSVGFWSTMLIVAVFLLVIRRAFKNARHTRIASEVEKNRLKKEFEENNKIEFDQSKRAIIAGPTHKSVV